MRSSPIATIAERMAATSYPRARYRQREHVVVGRCHLRRFSDPEVVVHKQADLCYPIVVAQANVHSIEFVDSGNEPRLPALRHSRRSTNDQHGAGLPAPGPDGLAGSNLTASASRDCVPRGRRVNRLTPPTGSALDGISSAVAIMSRGENPRMFARPGYLRLPKIARRPRNASRHRSRCEGLNP